MVIQKTINNLKDRPNEDKTVVAGGIAIAVVSILLIGWVFMFLKRIQSGAQKVELGGGIQEQFNFTSVKDAQEQLQQVYYDATDELRQIRDTAASQQVQTVQQGVEQQVQGADTTDQFGAQN